MKKVLSVLFICIMLCNIMPTDAFAETEEQSFNNSVTCMSIAENTNEIDEKIDNNFEHGEYNSVLASILEVANDGIKTVEDYANVPLFSGMQLMDVGDKEFYEIEPNDSANLADRIYHDYTVSGTLSGTDLLDYYVVDVPVLSEVKVVGGSNRLNFMIGVFNSDSEAVAVTTDLKYSNGYYFDGLTITLEAGQYYLVPLDLDSSSAVYTFYLAITPLHTHDYTNWIITEPTCINQGYTTYYCVCGDSFTDNYVAETGIHSYQNMLDVTCDVCGYLSLSEDEVYIIIEPDDSNVAMEVCDGYTINGFLSDSNRLHEYYFQINETSDVFILGTASSNGFQFDLMNSADPNSENVSFSESADIELDGIIYDEISYTLEPGEYHLYISEANNLNGNLAEVEYIFYVAIKPHEHNYNNGIATEPTCVEKGYTTYSCACGAWMKSDYIAATNNHSYLNILDTTCDVCGFVREVESTNTSDGIVAMYRLYNPNTGEHFYTGSIEERDILASVGWQYEGIAWNAPTKTGAPVYRLYNPNAGDHHYTMSAEERDNLVAVGWIYEGVAWNSASAENMPQYRLYNPNADCGSHHYTGSEKERDGLVSLGWRFEGIGWFGIR